MKTFAVLFAVAKKIDGVGSVKNELEVRKPKH
jgi:hypothetical protein